jgi:hypothetical protein
MKATGLYPMPPKQDDVRVFENRICEDNALMARYLKAITTPSHELYDGLTGDQKRMYHIKYTEAYHRGIEDTLALFIGEEPARLFMQHARVKHERIAEEKEARRKSQGSTS